MRKKIYILFALLLVTFTIVTPIPVLASSNSAMGDWGASYGLQGTTEVFYNSPWLVRFVQWFISWTCIIAFLTYYMSYLCSIVVLSNKELFYTIDALKRDKEGSSGEGGKGIFGSVFATFKNGAADAGLNGGADNIAVFFLMLSLNFKAYSVYKNVEAGSEGDSGGDGKGAKYAYSDTMASFFLKSLFNSVMVTFICSIALSGLLIRVWFTFGDVLILKADRFAQTNLSVKIDQFIGNDGAYTFTLASTGTKGGEIAQNVAERIYATVLAQFPDITEAQMLSIGKSVENAVYGTTAIATGPSTSLLGNKPDGYDSIKKIVNATLPTNKKLTTLDSEEQMGAVSIHRFEVNTNSSNMNNTQLVFPIDTILSNAGVKPPSGDTGLYAHVTLSYNVASANNYMKDK